MIGSAFLYFLRKYLDSIEEIITPPKPERQIIKPNLNDKLLKMRYEQIEKMRMIVGLTLCNHTLHLNKVLVFQLQFGCKQ